jgi:glycosyltransferase involved in cell wall biosynthesis
MRVAINGWFWDQPHVGSGQYTRQLLKRLLQIAPEHEYILITLEGSQPVTDDSSPKGVPCPSSLVNRNLGLRKVWFEQATFPRACRRLRADIAHAPYWGSPLGPGAPTVVTIHDIIPLLLPAYRGSVWVRTYTTLVQSAAANAALVLTDSECSKRDIVTHLGLPEARVRVVYLAADAAFSPAAQPDDDAVRAQYGLPAEYVLYIGGFDVRKNVVNLLQAWTFAEGILGPHTPLVIAGRLPEHSSFSPDPRRAARALEIAPDTIIFSGPIQEAHKPALYRGAVCLLFPSRYEGFGLPPLEALSCGAPVVGSHAGSIPEVVGDAGVLVAPDDVRGLAGALIAVATEPDTRAELSRRALAQAARFNWIKTARETLTAYEEVLALQ